MGKAKHVPAPPRRAPWRSGLGTPCRRRSQGHAAPSIAGGLALGLCCLAGLRAAADPPFVALDDGAAALACDSGHTSGHTSGHNSGRTTQGAALAVPGASSPPDVASADASLFRVSYDLSAGSGTLTRIPLVHDVDGTVRLLAPLWDAAAMLAAAPPAQRRIHTMGSDGGTVPFEWERLSPSQQAALDTLPAGTGSDGLGRQRVEWLRGDRTREGAMFRRRAGLLGDAVHGAPLYVGKGPGRYGDPAYAAFQQRTAAGTPAVYLGANDGMLHGFDAHTGAELFAYVPAMLVPQLNRLPAPDYRHRAYVDGPLAAGEAFARGAWRSVLVGSPGAGAQGLFALDVTDPAAFGEGAGALWEFTSADDPALGNVMQPAQVVRLKVRMRGQSPVYGDFAVTGNGVNGAAARGALFLLALDKPAAEPWRLDTTYYRLDTPAGDPALPAGLGAAALVTDEHHLLRHAYAGDLQGRLWRFDFTRSAPWRTNPALRPVFVARDPQGRAQPITQAPRIVHAEGGGYLVLFGTGSLYGRAERDPARFAPQSYYAVYDDPAAPTLPAPLERGDLAIRHADGPAGTGRVTVSGRHVSAGAGSRPKGWYVDFADGAATGERSLEPGAIADGKLVFTTVVPGSDPCADSATRRYVLDALTGLPVDAGGAPQARGVTGVLMPGVTNGPPLLLRGPRTRSIPEPAGRIRIARETAIVHFGAGTEPVVAGSGASWPAGRLSWREVANWRQLHRAAAEGGRP